MDTTLIGNTINMNLNYAKLDSIIADLQAKVATLEAAQNSSFDGDYSSLTNQPALFDGDYNSLGNLPTIPSNVSDLTNDAGFTTVSQADSIAVGVAWRLELSGADLAGVNLTGVNLTNANLSGADLSGADLNHTILSNANLSDADLTGAYVYGVYWTGAYILGCTGCTCTDDDNDNYCD